jgi:hypothetical protein
VRVIPASEVVNDRARVHRNATGALIYWIAVSGAATDVGATFGEVAEWLKAPLSKSGIR